MPLYEYECGDCGERTEAIQRFDDPPLVHCPECQGPLTRLISAPAFQFKGTGWYVTDYAGGRSKGGEGKAEAKESGAAAADTAQPKAGESGAKKKAASGEGA